MSLGSRDSVDTIFSERTEKTDDRLNLRCCEGQTECQTGSSRHAGRRRLAYTAKQYIFNHNAAIPE